MPAGCTSCPWVTQFIRHTSVNFPALDSIRMSPSCRDKTRRSRAWRGEGSVKEALKNRDRHLGRSFSGALPVSSGSQFRFCHSLQFRDQHCQPRNRNARTFEDNVLNGSARESRSIAILKFPIWQRKSGAATMNEGVPILHPLFTRFDLISRPIQDTEESFRFSDADPVSSPA